MLKTASIKLFFFFALFGAAYFLCDLATWGFTFSRLQTSDDLGFTSSTTTPSALQQTYTLHDQGGQSYVFLSEDGKYVLKFFKDMPRPWLPFPKYRAKKLGKLKRTLKGYQLAYDRLREETGLVYLHLAPTHSPLPVILIDRLHITHQADLSSVYFVLQKRAAPLSYILSLIPDKSLLLPPIQQLVHKRSLAHIADHDPRLHTNIGWIEDHPIFIDPGRFVDDVNASSKLPEKFLQHL